MSLAGDIVRAAIEKAAENNQRQAERVDATAAKLAEHVGKPWKFRIASALEALGLRKREDEADG